MDTTTATTRSRTVRRQRCYSGMLYDDPKVDSTCHHSGTVIDKIDIVSCKMVMLWIDYDSADGSIDGLIRFGIALCDVPYGRITTYDRRVDTNIDRFL